MWVVLDLQDLGFQAVGAAVEVWVGAGRSGASGEAEGAAWLARDEGQGLGDRCVDSVVETDTRCSTARPLCPPLILAWARLL